MTTIELDLGGADGATVTADLRSDHVRGHEWRGPSHPITAVIGVDQDGMRLAIESGDVAFLRDLAQACFEAARRIERGQSPDGGLVPIFDSSEPDIDPAV